MLEDKPVGNLQTILRSYGDEIITRHHDIPCFRINVGQKRRGGNAETPEDEMSLLVQITGTIGCSTLSGCGALEASVHDCRTYRIGVGVLVPDYHDWMAV